MVSSDCRSLFFVSIGVPIIEGYGLTETSPVIAINDPGRVHPGTVGRPVPGTEVKIAADGEILVRGPGVMAGYYRDPRATAEVMEEGWFRTGDVGSLDEGGRLRITARKKDLIVTSGGKNIAPQPIESALQSTGLVAQAVVVGDGRKFISALIAPDRDALARLCHRLGLLAAPVEDAIQHPDIVAAYESAVREACQEFAPYERVKKFALLPKELTIHDGELTPTLKVRRRVIEERYAAEIEAMYRGGA